MTRLLTDIPANDPLKAEDLKPLIDHAIAENKDRPGAVMLVLNEVQSKIGHVSPCMQAYIAQKLNVPPGQVHGKVDHGRGDQVVLELSFHHHAYRGR